MNQMQAFIEKAKNDKALMAKLDALGASGAEPVEQFSTQREILTPAAECQELSMPNLGALDERPSAGVSERLTFGDKMPGKVVALAAEYGFTITAEDYQQAVKATSARKSGELKEEDLEAAAGGILTENRYDPEVCSKYTETHYNCVGFLGMNWCDHYRRVHPENSRPTGRHTCVMGFFDYQFQIG